MSTLNSFDSEEECGRTLDFVKYDSFSPDLYLVLLKSDIDFLWCREEVTNWYK